ncbi:MAG: hypothetical protein ABR905_03905 [Terracidiphilus sp.]|jgi:hypothetical protein
MSPIRILSLLCVALLIPASAVAAGVPELSGSPATVSGVYSLTFNLRFATALPAGTTIVCRARIAPNAGVTDPWGQHFPAIPVKTVIKLAGVTGSTATCAQEIPIFWASANARNGAVLSYEIDAVSGSGSTPLPIKTSGLQTVGVALPAPAGRAGLSFDLTF